MDMAFNSCVIWRMISRNKGYNYRPCASRRFVTDSARLFNFTLLLNHSKLDEAVNVDDTSVRE